MANEVVVELMGRNEQLNESLDESQDMVRDFGKDVERIIEDTIADQLAMYLGDSMDDFGDEISDAEDYIVDLEEAVDDTAKETKSSFRAMGIAAKSFGDTVANVMTSVLMATPGAVLAVFGRIAGGLMSLGEEALPLVTGAASATEQSVKALESSLRRTGDTVGLTREQLETLSSAAEDASIFTQNAIRDSQTVLLRYQNIRGDKFIEAQHAAMNLASALGTDLAEAAKGVGEALEVPGDNLGLLEEAGIFFTDQQKEQIVAMREAGDVAEAQGVILDALAEKYGGAAVDKVETFAGKYTQLTNKLWEGVEALSTGLAPALDFLLPGLDSVITIVENGIPYLESAFKIMGSGANMVKNMLIPYVMQAADVLNQLVSTAEVVATDFDKVLELMAVSFQLWSRARANDSEHLFTVKIPAYFEWFRDNWQNLLRDYTTAWGTALKNILGNLGAFWDAAMRFASTGEFDPDFTPMLEGFKRTTADLPVIAERQMDEVERALAERQGSLVEHLGQRVSDTMQRNEDVLKDLMTERGEELVEGMVTNASDNFDHMIKKGEKQVRDLARTLTDVDKEVAKAVETAPQPAMPDEETIATGFEGIEDLAKRIESAQAEDPAKAMREEGDRRAQEAQEQVEALWSIDDAVRDFGRITTQAVGNVVANPAGTLGKGLGDIMAWVLGDKSHQARTGQAMEKASDLIGTLVNIADDVKRNLPLVGVYK